MLSSIQQCLPSVVQGTSQTPVSCGQELLEPHIWSMWPSAVWFCISWLLVAKLELFDSFSIGCIPPKLETPGKKLESRLQPLIVSNVLKHKLTLCLVAPS